MSEPRKKFYHSTGSRRDFMKMLGLGIFVENAFRRPR